MHLHTGMESSSRLNMLRRQKDPVQARMCEVIDERANPIPQILWRCDEHSDLTCVTIFEDQKSQGFR